MLTYRNNTVGALRGLAWVSGFLAATTMVAFIVAAVIPSNLALGLAIRWMRVVTPYANVGAFPPLLAVVLTPIQWLLVGLWLSHRIRGLGAWGAFAWTTFSVIVAGYGTGLLLGILGYRHVFEGP